MQRSLIIGFAMASLLAGPAFAQTSKAPTEATSGGIQMADTANMTVHFATPQSSDLMSSKLVGTKVYNNQNESVGEIDDLVLANGKTLTGVVVSVGGFLGMGEHYVLIDPSSLAVKDTNGTMKAFINASKDNLKNAPSFTYKKKS